MNKVLVNLFDRHNQGSLLAIDKIKPDKVIYIIDKEMESLFKEIEACEEKIYPKIKFENHVIDMNNIFNIKNILEKNNIKIDDKNINMEDLVRLVYENIS